MKELKSINELTEYFNTLPGIGHKTAEKLAYSVLEMKDEDIEHFSDALLKVKDSVHKCPKCGAFTEDELCDICNDETRDKTKIIVVSFPKDVVAFEKLRSYRGTYHVLGGSLSAINGVSIDDLNTKSLLERIKNDAVSEVIIATNPTIDGETTALYLAKILENCNVNITRLAYGLPMGGHLEYADSLTLLKALEGRKKI